jgi:hypothetical protein
MMGGDGKKTRNAMQENRKIKEKPVRQRTPSLSSSCLGISLLSPVFCVFFVFDAMELLILPCMPLCPLAPFLPFRESK